MPRSSRKTAGWAAAPYATLFIIEKRWYGLLTAEYGLLPPVRLRRIPKAVPLPDEMLLPIDLDHSVMALVGDQCVAVGKTDGRVLGGDEIWPYLPYGLAVRVQLNDPAQPAD